MGNSDKPTQHDAAKVAVRKFGAPPEIEDYLWIEAEVHGEVAMSVALANSGTAVHLEHSDATTYGTMSVGWNSQHRIAAYAWVPAER
jgi:hypothetical protein